ISIVPSPPSSSLFPYTTLFRSQLLLTDHIKRVFGRVVTRIRDTAQTRAGQPIAFERPVIAGPVIGTYRCGDVDRVRGLLQLFTNGLGAASAGADRYVFARDTNPIERHHGLHRRPLRLVEAVHIRLGSEMVQVVAGAAGFFGTERDEPHAHTVFGDDSGHRSEERRVGEGDGTQRRAD